MFGPETTEKSLLDIQRERVKSANYEGRVRDFTQRIKPLASKDTQDDDYYASKMSWSAKKKVSIDAMDSPLSQSLLRQHGDPEVKSLTLKTVRYDFDITSTDDEIDDIE